jgi:hypothetical protein
VRPVGLFGQNLNVVTLRSRYAELLRLRGRVQQLERLCRDDAQSRKQKWLDAKIGTDDRQDA